MNLLKYMQILSFVLPVAFLSCSNDTIEDVHYTPQTKIMYRSEIFQEFA